MEIRVIAVPKPSLHAGVCMLASRAAPVFFARRHRGAEI